MPLRVEVHPGGAIELMRTRVNTGELQFLHFTDVQRFLRVFYFLLKREIHEESEARFTPALDLECRKLLRLKLKERENGQKT